MSLRKWLCMLGLISSLCLLIMPTPAKADPSDPDVLAELQAAADHSSLILPKTTAEPIMPRSLPSSTGSVIYFSDFESDNGGMNGTRDWEWGIYNWNGTGCYNTSNNPPPSAYSGIRMWGTVLDTCHQNLGNNQGYESCINTNKSDDSILSFTVDLSGLTNASLSWWEWFDLFLEWDWGEVYVNDTVVFQHCGGSYVAPTAWVEQMIDLTPFVGGPVTISFHMMSSTVVNYAGWYIDDVQVVGSRVSKTIPTLSEWGMIIFSMLLAASAIWMVRRRQAS